MSFLCIPLLFPFLLTQEQNGILLWAGCVCRCWLKVFFSQSPNSFHYFVTAHPLEHTQHKWAHHADRADKFIYLVCRSLWSLIAEMETVRGWLVVVMAKLCHETVCTGFMCVVKTETMQESSPDCKVSCAGYFFFLFRMHCFMWESMVQHHWKCQ